MSRDDWKYYDEDIWDEKEEEKKESPTIQCVHCTRYTDSASPYCVYCGRPLTKR
jgi:hypothetical protein